MPSVLSLFGVEPLRIGGTESFAREVSRQLGAAGWESVLCFAGPALGNVRRFLELPNVTLESLPAPEHITRAGLAGLARLLRRHRPEILHLHYVGFVTPYPWVARLVGTRRVYFTDHASRPAGHVPRRAAAAKRMLTRLINWPLTAVTTPTEYGRRCLAALDVLPMGRVQIVPNAVDLARVPKDGDVAAEFRRRHRIPADRALVVQVSWLIPEKGIDDLLEAARLVVDRRPSVHFAVVGDGAHRERYLQRTRELGLECHVTFTGLLQDPLAEGAYAAADVVCQVSRWEEIFGWTITEAMASARPVVATRVGGIPEVVADGETGLLVPPRNPQAVADAITRLLDDRDTRAVLGQAGRVRVERHFELGAAVSQILGLYGIPTDPS
jgi:glycosyltransferase involved in cell wall biosynthesis